MADLVLVVEDDPANAVLVEAILSSVGGYEVACSDDGDEVLSAIQERPVVAVLMDVSLGRTRIAGEKVDGVALTRRIRDLPEGINLPVILLTAHAMKGDRERCLEGGMDGYVSKPIRAQELLDAILQFCRPADASPPATPTEFPPCPTAPEEGQQRPSADLIDWSAALHSVDGDPGLLRLVVKAFLEECPVHLQDLGVAIERQDAKSSCRLAHLIKGVMGTLGSPIIRQTAREVEELCLTEQFDEAAGQMITLTSQLDQMTAVLTDFTNGDLEPF